MTEKRFEVDYDITVGNYCLHDECGAKGVDENEGIRELLQDNDHKFWKLRVMHQFNSTSLIMHEISLAIIEEYEVSGKFKEYLDECK